MLRYREVFAKFWRLVDIRSDDECWPWRGHRAQGRPNDSPRGAFNVGLRVKGSRTAAFVLAHRFAWEITNARPAPLCICHACDNPLCVNPKHLWPGSIADNNADKKAKGRQSRGVTHGSARLTVEDVLEIRNQISKGVPNPVIARQFKVRPQTVSKIGLRRRWSHV